jgi:putative transcriptional regulator
VGKMGRKQIAEADVFEGQSFGELLAEGLQDLAETLRSDPQSVPQKFACRTLDLSVEPTVYTPELVQETRRILGVSPTVFSKFLGVSVRTVHAWERGDNVPKESACRFMDEIRAQPGYFVERIRSMAVPRS